MQIRAVLYTLLISGCLAVLVTTSSAHAKSETLLGSKVVTTSPTSELPRWQKILNSHTSELYSARSKSKNIQNWEKFITSVQGTPKLRQLLKVNMWFKQFSYKQDNWVYQQDDYWATPAEFLTKGGDCEDFAIIKYMTLRKLGFPAKDMKISIVYDVYSGTGHAFLVVKHDGAEFVLDNREKLVVARYMKNRYKPHYAFNENKVWVYDSPKMVKKVRKNSNGLILPGNR